MTRNLTLIMLFLAGAAVTLSAQVQRKVFIEEFTQASCPPCSFHNPPFDALMEANKDKVVLVKHETWWPGYGPFYEANPNENRTWIQYNGITGAPNVQLGGTTLPTGQYFAGAPLNVTQAMINQWAAQMSPLMIEVDHELNSSLDSITVNVTVINVTDQPVTNNDMRLYMTLMENDLKFDAPPGTNGETHFIHTTRKFIPGVNGISLGNEIAANDTLHFTEKMFVPTYLYRHDVLAVAAWVQVRASRSVLQSEISWPKPITAPIPDLSSSMNLSTGSSLCELNGELSIEVINEGNGAVDSFSYEILINGDAYISAIWNSALAPGDTVSIALPQITLVPGRNVVTLDVSLVEGRELSILNNQNSSIQTKLDPAIYSDVLNEGFESAARGDATVESAILLNPGGYRFFVVNRDQSGNVNYPLGAYEQSENCYRFDFYQIPAGGQGSLVFRKIDMTDYRNSFLAFSYAYTNQSNQNDRLQVVVSDDCGVTWTEVFNKAGNELKTANSVSGTWFYPRANHWVTDTSNISAFDGASELMVAFIGTSDVGNSLYLDDVMIGQSTTSVIDAGILAGNVSVFPNPTSGPVQINIELSEPVTATIQVMDLTGRLITTISSAQSLNAGRHQFEWTGDVANGVYLLKVLTDKGQVTERITVAQ